MHIPRAVHQIWIQGVDRLPPQYRATTRTWQMRNPGWVHRVWDEPSIRALMIERVPGWWPLYAMQPEVEAKADIARYALLDAMGGLYADIDTECRRPIERLLAGDATLQLTFFSGDTREPVDCATNSVIASCPGHPIWRLVMQSVERNDLATMVVCRTGPDMLRPILRGYADEHPGDVRLIGYPHAITTAMMPRRTMRAISWIRRENFILDFNDSARRAFDQALGRGGTPG
jgi:mannosyltransferase OCH1-like enzyme